MKTWARQMLLFVAHDEVRKRMSHDNFIKAFNKKIPASPKVALPIITFHLNNQEIQVIHQDNSHTDGDSIVSLKLQMLYTWGISSLMVYISLYRFFKWW